VVALLRRDPDLPGRAGAGCDAECQRQRLVELRPAVLDATVVHAAVIDAAVIDPSVIDPSVVDAAVIDATVESAAVESAAVIGTADLGIAGPGVDAADDEGAEQPGELRGRPGQVSGRADVQRREHHGADHGVRLGQLTVSSPDRLTAPAVGRSVRFGMISVRTVIQNPTQSGPAFRDSMWHRGAVTGGGGTPGAW
jgi:hypothetical protein